MSSRFLRIGILSLEIVDDFRILLLTQPRIGVDHANTVGIGNHWTCFNVWGCHEHDGQQNLRDTHV